MNELFKVVFPEQAMLVPSVEGKCWTDCAKAFSYFVIFNVQN